MTDRIKAVASLRSAHLVITPRGLIRGYPLVVNINRNNRPNVWAALVQFLEKCACPAEPEVLADIKRAIRVIRTATPDDDVVEYLGLHFSIRTVLWDNWS